MIRNATPPRALGITLVEILIAIMILGIGLISLATLFPIGLLRLREAQRQIRSSYLSESAIADVAARGLFNANSFLYVDLINIQYSLTPWYVSPIRGRYDPLIQDTAYYSANAYDDLTNPGAMPPLQRGDTAYHLLTTRSGAIRLTTATGGSTSLTPSTRTTPRGRPSSGSLPATRPPARRCGPTRMTGASPAPTACSG